MSRVVITGVGVVSPIGNTKEEFWNSLMEGKHGFTLEQWFPGQSEELNVKASVKDFSADGLFDKKELRRTDIITQYAVYAADKAVWKQRRKSFSHITTRATREFQYSLSPR